MTPPEQPPVVSPVTLSDRMRGRFAQITTRAGEAMVALHIHPDVITWVGLGVILAASVFIARGEFVIGGLLLLISLPLDALDGATARAMGRTDRRGAVLDSSLDRYADGFIYGGLSVYFATVGDIGYLVLAQVALIGTFAVSYLRARAGEAGLSVKIGILSRFERVLIMLVMFLVPALLLVGLWILAIGTHVTAMQRLVYVYRHLDRP